MAFARYTLYRLVLLLAVAGLFWLLGFRGLWLLLIAIFTSGVISLFVLSRSRDAASTVIYTRLHQIGRRLDEQSAAEDAWDEEQRRHAEPEDHGRSDSTNNHA